jgi:nitric oxide reductase subunit B
VSYYDARTLNYIGSRANSVLEWLRMPGDVVFILGGILPLLYICFQGVRFMRKGTATEEPGEILFTEVVAQSTQV